MALLDLASFPNSRIKPRSATRLSTVGQVVIPANTATLLRPELAERTTLTIYNQSLSGTLRYKRGVNTNINVDGFLLGPDRAIDLDGPQNIWVYCSVEIIVSFDDSIG